MHTPLNGAQFMDAEQTPYIQGLRALRNGDAEGAARLLSEALRWQPAHRGMRRNLVRALLAAGRFQDALVQSETGLVHAPDDAELHYAQGSALSAVGDPVRACAALTRATKLRPDHAPSCLNLASARAELDDLESAEILCRKAIRLDPNLSEAHASLGFILTTQGRVTAAIEACETAIRLQPDFSQAHWNLAIAALLGGDLSRGFAAYEWRTRHRLYQRDFVNLPGPVWDGGDPAGKTILVRSEQGYGDTIQCARYLPLIRDAGGLPVLLTKPAVKPLVRCMRGIQIVENTDRLPSYDAWIDQMSLPHVFGTTLATIPEPGGYLQAEAARVGAWRRRLPGGRKVGVVFAGNPLHRNDRRRSIPLELVSCLPDIPGITFVNLQHGPAAAGLRLADLSAQLPDFAETAALVENLDLVVTVDTSIAHLAGALGKPAWVLLPAAPDWRWLLERSDSPWYASLRLMRQERAGDWSSVLARVMRALPSVAGSAPLV